MAPLEKRPSYKEVWNLQAVETAPLAVAGHSDEETLGITGRAFVETLRELVGLNPLDVVLEIGCGIGRVGKPLSKECLQWFGADISGEMLRHAAKRLVGLGNVTFVELATVGLQELPSDVFDLVYCTIVFMHLLEWDRFRYVEEAFRVLRPGGRFYVDNFSLDSDLGWKVFSEGAAFPVERRPAQISMSSSRDEFHIFLARAGFVETKVIDLPNGLIAGIGSKPI